MNNHNFNHLNIAGIAHSALSVASLQDALDGQQALFRKISNISAGMAHSAKSISSLQDALDRQQALFRKMSNIDAVAHSAKSISSLQDALDRQQALFRKMSNIDAVAHSALSVTSLQDALDRQQALFRKMSNIGAVTNSALSVASLQDALDKQQALFRKMSNIGAVTNSALSVASLQDALDKQQVLFDITQKHFKGYETIQEKIQEFFEAADERQRQLNELLDNSALPLSQPLLPEDFLTTPEKTESTFPKPITKKVRHRSQQIAHDLCKKYKHQKAKAFYTEISSLPIAKLDKTNTEILIMVLAYFKNDIYSEELNWLVNFLFMALISRLVYLANQPTSSESTHIQ